MITLGENTSANAIGSQLIYPHECFGLDTLLMVSITFTNPRLVALTSVTHNGRAMTRKVVSQMESKLRTEIWYLVAPDASGDIEINFDTSTKCICVAQTIRGVKQDEPFYFDTTVAAKNVISLPITFQMIDGNMLYATGIIDGDQEANVEVWQTQMWNILFADVRSQGIASFPNMTGEATVSNTLSAPGDLSMAILGISAA